VTQLLEGFTRGNSFTLGFEMHRFNNATATWNNEGYIYSPDDVETSASRVPFER
jgi:hypothetical protein